MRKFVLTVALVAFATVVMRAPMADTAGMGATSTVSATSAMSAMSDVAHGADAPCVTEECPAMPPLGACLTVCVAVVALLAGIATTRRPLDSSRVRVASSPFVDQLSGSSIFRPPRLTPTR
jgi:hypothetical protein